MLNKTQVGTANRPGSQIRGGGTNVTLTSRPSPPPPPKQPGNK
jgi:hypothetical protein